jgi:hypothetical protein
LYKLPPTPCFIVVKWLNFSTQFFYIPRSWNYVEFLWEFYNYHFSNLNYTNAKLKKFVSCKYGLEKGKKSLKPPKDPPSSHHHMTNDSLSPWWHDGFRFFNILYVLLMIEFVSIVLLTKLHDFIFSKKYVTFLNIIIYHLILSNCYYQFMLVILFYVKDDHNVSQMTSIHQT